MNTNRRLITALALFVGFAFMPVQAVEKSRLSVVTTFSILADLVAQVGGDRVEVYSLVGADEDAHVFHASPRDIRQVAQADLLVLNGLGFEGWLDRVIASSHYRGKTLVATNGIKVLSLEADSEGHDHHHDDHGEHQDHDESSGRLDPHAWHSLSAAEVYIRNIAEALKQVDPKNRDYFSQKSATYIAKLQALRDRALATLSAIPEANRHIVVPHNAFSYLAAEFGLHVHSLQGVSTESEASAYQVARVIRQVKNNNIQAIFAENISNKRLIEQVQRETQARLGGELISGALSKDLAPTYLMMMERNLDTIFSALK